MYLVRRLENMDDARIVGNLRLWSWLGMFYFDAVVRKDGIGYLRLDNSDTQFAIDPNDQGRGVHRHQLMLAYEIYARHPNDAWLTGPPVRKGGAASDALTETIRLAQAPIIRKTSVLMLPNRL